MDLPCFSSVLAYLTEAHDVPDARAEGLDRIRCVVRDAEHWEKALQLWAIAQDDDQQHRKAHQEQTTTAAAGGPGTDPSPSMDEKKQRLTYLERVNHLESFAFTFRSSALRDGQQHEFQKMDIYVASGDAVCERFGEHAKVSLLEYELEVGQ